LRRQRVFRTPRQAVAVAIAGVAEQLVL